MNTKFENLDINELVIIPTGLNNLKTKVDDSDVTKLKTVPMEFQVKWCIKYRICEKDSLWQTKHESK